MTSYQIQLGGFIVSIVGIMSALFSSEQNILSAVIFVLLALIWGYGLVYDRK